MKKLFTILFVTIITSCNAPLEPPKNNSDYRNIIGKPIKFDSIEIAQYNFPEKMNWHEANKACKELGHGWVLPTKKRLNILFKNKDKIGGFMYVTYWSSTQYGFDRARCQNFITGYQGIGYIKYSAYVRAVRIL